jgi:hypothetical protein
MPRAPIMSRAGPLAGERVLVTYAVGVLGATVIEKLAQTAPLKTRLSIIPSAYAHAASDRRRSGAGGVE